MISPFVHLHVHTEYSLVDGLIRISDLIESARANKMPAISITDFNNLFGMVKFYEEAIAQGIKPIIGADVWIENEIDGELSRIILLCKNESGYKTLTRLISRSYLEEKKEGKALIKKSWLTSKLNQGLIAIACIREHEITRALEKGQKEIAEMLIEYWTGIFPNHFYLEITRIGLEEGSLLENLVQLASRKQCPLVATNDVRFLHRDDFEAHEARVCIHSGYTLTEKRKSSYTEEQYLKNQEEMNFLFSDLKEAIENSFEISKRCNFELKLHGLFLPHFPVPLGKTISSYLIELSNQGLQERLKFILTKRTVSIDVYQSRLDLELKVIHQMGFSGYFLIVADFIQWAKNNRIPVGPGRGSGVGSLVAYALSITDLDPLQYDLLFERFLNPERVSMPDFDVDFCMDGRDKVIEYVANTYGRDSVAQIITYGTMTAKAVIRDVGRVLGHPYGFVDKIAKLVPMELGMTLEKAIREEETLRERYSKEDDVKTLIDLAKKLEGITRNVGKHAGGVVIAPSKLIDFTPLYAEEQGSTVVTQFDKNDVETIGLVKFDFLGLRTLTIIDWAIRDKPDINMEHIPLDDSKTFELLQRCETTAVFQLESRGMKDLIRRLKPDCFEDIIALVALFRPGPLQSGMVDDFIDRKLGRCRIEYPHPALEPILKPTYGIILYQEQVMQIAQVLAGYTLGAADLLRRAMGKKKAEEMADQREIFTKGSEKQGVPVQLAHSIFDLMEKFAGYGFNKSHAAAYALITYQTAWLKTHYTASFMAAVLSADMAHTDKVVIFIEDAKKQGLTVLPPDVNTSIFKFSVDQNGRILYGLGAIKGVGETAIESILEARKRSGSFKDLFDFCARVDLKKVTKRVLEALIRGGSMDVLGDRAALMDSMDVAIGTALQWHKNIQEGQADLFGNSFSASDLVGQTSLNKVASWSDEVRLIGEKMTLGLYLTGHPIDAYAEELKNLISCKIDQLVERMNTKQRIAGFVVNLRTLQTKRGDRMAFATLDDKTGRQEVAIFSDLYKTCKDKLQGDPLLITEGDVSHDEYSSGIRFRVKDLLTLEEARIQWGKQLDIVLMAKDVKPDFTVELKKLLTEYSGYGTRVLIRCMQNNLITDLELKDWKVEAKTKLMDSLKLLPGVLRVDIQYS